MQGYIYRGLNKAKCALYLFMHPFLWRRSIRIHGIPKISFPKAVVLGQDIAINDKVFIQGDGGVSIGDNVVLSYGTTILTQNMDYTSLIDHRPERKHVLKSVTIGNNTWVAANVTILPGVTVPANCVIAAGAVVTKNLPYERALYAGNPAVFIKYL